MQLQLDAKCRSQRRRNSRTLTRNLGLNDSVAAQWNFELASGQGLILFDLSEHS